MSTHKRPKGLLWIAFIILLLGILVLTLRLYQAEWKSQAETKLKFTSVDLDFTHQFDAIKMLPFLGSAAFDVDGDGRDEAFLGGGIDQSDQIFKLSNGAFRPLNIEIRKAPGTATHGAAHLDIDKDGDVDLFTARSDGVWLHENTGGQFASQKLDLDIADNTTPLSIALGDYNADGWMDFYVSGYIKIENVEGQTVFTRPYGGYSYLFENNGDNSWRDVSREAGIWRQHNTFTAVFADIDNDNDSDLVIAQDTGHVEMYENTGSLPFKPIKNPSVNSYPMGVAAGDYNNDGLIDFFFSNVGHTLPATLLRGDLPKDAPFNTDYMLFRNNGDLSFTDTAQETETARLGFGWGTVAADIDLDGWTDLLAAQNYARLPANSLMYRYPGKILLNQNGEGFLPAEKRLGATNKAFGITPLLSDFDGDGDIDIIWANIDGPSKAYLNQSNSHSLKVILPNTTRFLNARLELSDTNGDTQTQQVIAGQGLGSDQSRTPIFGIDPKNLKVLSIRLNDGTLQAVRAETAPGIIEWSDP